MKIGFFRVSGVEKKNKMTSSGMRIAAHTVLTMTRFRDGVIAVMNSCNGAGRDIPDRASFEDTGMGK